MIKGHQINNTISKEENKCIKANTEKVFSHQNDAFLLENETIIKKEDISK